LGVKIKRKIILLHDNTKLYVTKDTRQTIEDTGWEVLSHQPYSPDYHLLGCKGFLSRVIFNNVDKVQKAVDGYFQSMEKKLYWLDIHNLPIKWENVIDAKLFLIYTVVAKSNGHYNIFYKAT